MRTIDFKIQTRIESGKSQWLFLLPVNDSLHDGKRTRLITESLCRRVLDQTNAMYDEFRLLAGPDKTPFRLSLVNEHDLEGDSFGVLTEFKLTQKGTRNGIWAHVDYTPTGKRLVDSKKKRFVSVRIVDNFMTQRGKSFGPVIAEVSLTNYPRVQSAGEITDTAGMALSLLKGNEMSKLFALIAMLLDPEVQDALATVQSTLEDDSTEETPEVTEDDTVALAASVTALVAKVESLSDKLDKVTNLNLSRRGSGGNAPAPKTDAATYTQAYESEIAKGKKPAAARLIASFATEA